MAASFSPSPVSLDYLPDDILILILTNLEVRDILAIRRTCKTFCATSHVYSVWVAAVGSLLRRLPLPGIEDLRDMSGQLSHEGIEALAVNALKLERNWCSESPVPTSCTLIKGARHIDKLQLLDHGRWLLALTDGEKLTLYSLAPNFSNGNNGYPIIFQPAVRVAETVRASGRGWHCGFEADLQGRDVKIMLSWRNETDLLRLDLSQSLDKTSSTPRGGLGLNMRFETIASFDRIRESATTPCAIDSDLIAYPLQCGQIKIVNWKTGEEGIISTWHPSPATAVAERWSRDDIVAVKLLSSYVLVVKPSSFQFFPLPGLQQHIARTISDPSIRPGPVFHLPFVIDCAVFSEKWKSSADPTSTGTVLPLSIFVRDVNNWVLVHYQLKPSHIDGPPYTFPPQIIDELNGIAFTPRDRHNTFAIGRTGARGVVQGPNSILGYTNPRLASNTLLGADRMLSDLAVHTPLQRLESANGMSIDEGTGRIAIGEADGDIWVFSFGSEPLPVAQ